MKLRRVRQLVCLLACGWVVVVPPGLSYYWLIDPEIHAQIDVERYGQSPHGQTLPGFLERPPHEHPASLGIGVSIISLTSVLRSSFCGMCPRGCIGPRSAANESKPV